MLCVADNQLYVSLLHICDTYNHNYMCHICAKGYLDSNLNKAVIDKVSNFNEIAPNFTYLLKS